MAESYFKSLFCSSSVAKYRSFVRVFFQERYHWCDIDINHISYIPLGKRSTELRSTLFNFLPESVVILTSCNGLICCRSSFPSYKPMLYVCNPLNKEWIGLEWIHPSKRTSVALVFDPFSLPISDASTNFKVVSVSHPESETEEYEYLFHIYSSETGKWKQSGEVCKCKHNLFKNKGIFVDGSLYWLTDGDEILMFDPELDLCWLITMPLPITDFQVIPEMCIGESKGKLHYVLLTEEGLQLWVLEDPFASYWYLALSISVAELEKENSKFIFELAEKMASRVSIDIPPWMDILSFKDGFLFVRISTDVYSFQFETRKMEMLCNLKDLGKNSMNAPIVLPYSMSLAPLGLV